MSILRFPPSFYVLYKLCLFVLIQSSDKFYLRILEKVVYLRTIIVLKVYQAQPLPDFAEWDAGLRSP